MFVQSHVQCQYILVVMVERFQQLLQHWLDAISFQISSSGICVAGMNDSTMKQCTSSIIKFRPTINNPKIFADIYIYIAIYIQTA